MPRIIKTADERVESSKIACSKYYYSNKEKINQDPHRKEYNARFQRLAYDEQKKKEKSEYYFRNRNYRNLNFSKDIVKMFSIPLEGY